MKVGILVNTDKNLKHLIGITDAILRKGHEAMIFAMDEGVRLLEKNEFNELCKMNGVSMSFCDHSTHVLEVKKNNVPEEIICGSQYNNSLMNHETERVIIL